jgi:hypothetical protein
MPWQIFAAFPNLDLRFACEARDAAISPLRDPRVDELRAQHPNLEEFLNRFRSAHGSLVHPAVLLFSTDGAAGRQTEEALVALRNCLSTATVLRQTAKRMIGHAGQPLLFSDPFELYPWALDRDFNRMISITPALMALHRVDEFSGQPLPGSPVHTLDSNGVDRVLLTALIARWDVAFGRQRIGQMDRALFRSLNMANAAMAMPATKGATLFDYGRQCALWISAFEILAHFDSGRNRADLPAVLQLLAKKPFWSRELRARRYTIRAGRGPERAALPMKLYERLYRVRNDFLHGNPVTARTLQIPGSRRFIGWFAPLLYRFALRNFLDLQYVQAGPAGDLESRIRAAFAEREYERTQYETEEAVLLARGAIEAEID